MDWCCARPRSTPARWCSTRPKKRSQRCPSCKRLQKTCLFEAGLFLQWARKIPCFSHSGGCRISHTSVEFSHSASVLFCGLLGDNGVEMGELQHFFLSFCEKICCIRREKRNSVDVFFCFAENCHMQLHHTKKDGKLTLHRNFDRNVTIPIKFGNLSIEKG